MVGESLWKGAISQRLSGGTGRRQLAFTLPSAGLDKGARMIWSFHITSITTPVEVLMAVDYSDGSTALLERQLMSEGRQEIALQTDSTRKPQLVYGYLRAPQSSQLLLDSITLTSQPLNRINYYDIHSQKQLK